jgi:hypothetical protein
MTLAQAMMRVHVDRMARDLSEKEIMDIHHAIRASSGFRRIVEVNIETVNQYGALSTVECATGMGIRFGIEVGQLLQRANAGKSQPANESTEERQNKEMGELPGDRDRS